MVSVLGPRVSGYRSGRRTHTAFDLASVFHHALLCPWYLSEQDATGSVSVALELWAAFQPKRWIYADSSTLTSEMLFSLMSTVEFSKSAKVCDQFNLLLKWENLRGSAKVACVYQKNLFIGD